MLSIGCGVTNSDIQSALEKSRNEAAKKRGDTELHITAARGDSSAVSNLIRRGTNLNAVNDNDQTALMLAIRQEQPATARMLIEQGAKLDVADEQGDTALHLAIRNGQRDIVQALLAQGADPNRPNKAKDTPLLLATKVDYPDITSQLLEKNARINVVDSYGLTPLHYATNWHQTSVAQKLIQQGLHPDVKAPDGQTPLMVATYFGDLPTASLLLEKGARADLSDEKGRTSLHLAAQNGHTNVVATLLDHGADINGLTKAGHTAVLLAAQNDQADTVRYVVSRGAQFIPLGESPRTAFSSALVAQTIAEEAQARQNIPKAREYHKFASDWFEKAATGYQDAADTADLKILTKTILKGAAVVALTVGLAVASQQYASYQNQQQARMAALGDAVASGSGHQGYFSQVVKYENAFQSASYLYSYPATVNFSAPSMQTPSLFQNDAALEHLRDIYRKLAQQSRDHAQRNATHSTAP